MIDAEELSYCFKYLYFVDLKYSVSIFQEDLPLKLSKRVSMAWKKNSGDNSGAPSQVRLHY